MKYKITNLDTTNDPSSFEFPILGNYVIDSYFSNFIIETSNITKIQKSELLLWEDNSEK
jgi:hypothetical protein